MRSLLAELKRRKVFRVVAVYAVVAWLLIQVADVVLPTFGAPAWVNQTLIFLFMLGFPLALILAWAYETTPEGIKPDHEVRASPGLKATSAQPINYLILAIVLLVAATQLITTFGGDVAPNPLGPDTSGTSVSALPPATVLRATLNLEEALGQHPSAGVGISLQLTPDGSQLLYTVYDPEGSRLFIRDLSSQTTQALGRSVIAPVLSPNGDRLIGGDLGRTRFEVHRLGGGILQTHDIDYGNPVTDWLSENEILFTPQGFNEPLAIHRLSLDTGAITPETPGDIDEVHQNPWVLPGADAFLYNSTCWSCDGNASDIRLHDLVSASSRTLVRGGYLPRYTRSGHIVFIRDGDLWAVPFDMDDKELAGPETRVVEGIESYPFSSYASLAFSENGRLVYMPGQEFVGFSNSLAWTDRDGNRERVSLPQGNYGDPELSPAGERLALTVYQPDGVSDIWILDLRRGTLSRTTMSGDALNPKWMPDGDALVYARRGQGIWQSNANATGQPQQLVAEANVRPDSFAGDENTLFYLQGTVGDADIMQLTYRDSTWLSTPLLDSDYNEWGSVVSPDGNWIAYVSDESGNPEVFVRPYPNIEDGKWQISTASGREPRWRNDSGELYYLEFLQGAPSLMAVEISTEDGFEASIPQPLFTDVTVHTADPPNYAVTGDGNRFLYTPRRESVEPAGSSGGIQLMVVENWFEELNRLAPANQVERVE